MHHNHIAVTAQYYS